MKKITCTFFVFFCLALLGGCESGGEPISQTDPRANMTREERQQEVNAFFEKMRASNRTFLATAAQNNPDELAVAMLSLTDFHPIVTMEEFVQKFPALTVVEYEFSVKGAKHLEKINPDISLHENIQKAISRYRVYLEDNISRHQEIRNTRGRDEAIASEQVYLDALNAGNIRTYGFSVKGKLKDIEEMAKLEYGEKYVRVIALSARINGELMSNYFDPVYAEGIPSGESDK